MTPCEKGSSDICRQCSSRSALAFTQLDLRVTMSADMSLRLLFNKVSDFVALSLDYAEAQAYLELHSQHIPVDPFSQDVLQILFEV